MDSHDLEAVLRANTVCAAILDGAGTLGPQWERYGKTPEVPIEPGNVFAVEMDVEVPGYGVVGLEEEALVEEDGARYLSQAQRELWLLPG